MRQILALALMAIAFAAVAAPRKTDNKTLLAAKALVEDRLKDAESARFKDVELRHGDTYLCGKVNAKTSGGGYAGFKRFYVKVLESKVLFEDDDYYYDQTWRQFCE